MIKRLLFKDLVTFSHVELEFEKGLVVFTGPSGAGKSVLISTILSSFGYPSNAIASLCEVTLQKPKALENEAYLLEDEIVIKTVKKEKLRHFIHAQRISKKLLRSLFAPYVQYLSVRDKSGFESSELLALLEKPLLRHDKTYRRLRKEFIKRYAGYEQKQKALAKLHADEAQLANLIEYATYEIEKIARIDPQLGEDESLMKLKQQLSRVDKLKESLKRATEIFQYESAVEEVYRLLGKESGAFNEMMNQLRADFEESEQLSLELEELDVEKILDRLSDITSLKQRYGSIAEALAYKADKEKELQGYQNIGKDKQMLESFLAMEGGELMTLAQKLSLARKAEAKRLERVVSNYLETLKLPSLTFSFETKGLSESGSDVLSLHLGDSSVGQLSGGEFNRVRLALMASTMQEGKEEGVLILDEIDANVSGDESIAIAQMISKLSLGYQIFAISHQPHLSAQAQQHIVVTKDSSQSEVVVLSEAGRIDELSRIIAGENPTSEAVEFAKKLRASST